jgi:hypothetical protein
MHCCTFHLSTGYAATANNWPLIFLEAEDQEAESYPTERTLRCAQPKIQRGMRMGKYWSAGD